MNTTVILNQGGQMIDDTKAPAEWAPIATIQEWPKNPKPHPDNNVAAIARSIARFGFIDPVTVWRSKGWIAAGHGRARAAALLMREDAGRRLSTDAPGPGLIPVRFVEFASEAEFAAFAIANNRLTEVNPMDGAAVADILQEIADAGGDVQIPGYEEAEIAAMLGEEQPIPDADTSPALGDGLTYSILLSCRDEMQQGDLLQRLESEGYTCRPLIS